MYSDFCDCDFCFKTGAPLWECGVVQGYLDRIKELEIQLAFREQQIKDACALLIHEPNESAPGVETLAHQVEKILWRPLP